MSKNDKKATTTAETITQADVGSLPAEVVKAASAPVALAPVSVATRVATGKSAIAQAIFDQSYANFATDPKSVPQRKDILQRCIDEAGLTPAGAATYLQNYKRKHGYSTAPATTTAAPAAEADKTE